MTSVAIRIRSSRVRHAVPGLADVCVDRPRHQRAADPVVERDRRTAARIELGRVGRLPRKLHRPAVGSRGSSIRACSSGLGPCTINGVSYPDLHDERQPATSGACCRSRRKSRSRRRSSATSKARRGRHAGLSRAEAVGAAPRGERRQPERELHAGRAASALDMTTSFGQVGSGFLKPDDPSFDRGNCTQDRRISAT